MWKWTSWRLPGRAAVLIGLLAGCRPVLIGLAQAAWFRASSAATQEIMAHFTRAA